MRRCLLLVTRTRAAGFPTVTAVGGTTSVEMSSGYAYVRVFKTPLTGRARVWPDNGRLSEVNASAQLSASELDDPNFCRFVVGQKLEGSTVDKQEQVRAEESKKAASVSASNARGHQ
jgi:hypothetical protein